MPEKVNKIFRNVAAKRALWVFFDSNFCQKQVCRNDSVQKSVLKVTECRTFSASGCQGVSSFPISGTSVLPGKIRCSILVGFSLEHYF